MVSFYPGFPKKWGSVHFILSSTLFQPQGWLQLCFGLAYGSKILTSFTKNWWLGRLEWESLFALLLPPAFPWRKPIKVPLYWALGRSVPKMKASGLPLLAAPFACEVGQRGHSCYLSAEQKREGEWSVVCLLLHWGKIAGGHHKIYLFSFPLSFGQNCGAISWS